MDTVKAVRVGIVSGAASMALVAGGFFLGGSLASAQTPPAPTPQTQPAPQTPNQPGARPQGDHECPDMDGSSSGNSGAGGAGLRGPRSFRQ